MLRFSEYVSLGHPDKVADYISQYLLDRYIECDPNTRYAVEVQVKDGSVTLGGEVASRRKFTRQQIAAFVRHAVREIGYTRDYQVKWGEKNAICGDELFVYVHVGQQSPDIAQGLSGWGDQGIFFGMCEYGRPDGMPLDHAIAKRLCKALFESGLGGLDIKTQVVTDDDEVKKIIVAIPLLPFEGCTSVKDVEKFVRKTVPGTYELIINGTGRYVTHSSMADCGTTGRKLAVDFYGGNCRIGGGSPWTKDATKADLTLNLVARHLARKYAAEMKCSTFVRLACCIGRQDVDICVQDKAGNILAEGTIQLNPMKLRREMGLDKPIYASMCRWGLFGEYQQDKFWEQ